MTPPKDNPNSSDEAFEALLAMIPDRPRPPKPPQVAVARLAPELKRQGGTTAAIARRLDTSRRQIDRLIAIAEAGDPYLARLADGEPAHKLADESRERAVGSGSAKDAIHG